MGDKVLAATAQLLQTSLREVDTVARVGGDEFALILWDIIDATYVIQVIQKMMQRFEKNIEIDDLSIQVTLSLGIAIYPRDGNHSLLEKADAAMYYAKEHGKNKFKLFNEMCDDRTS
jgi:diguanylate cyclase